MEDLKEKENNDYGGIVKTFPSLPFIFTVYFQVVCRAKIGKYLTNNKIQVLDFNIRQVLFNFRANKQ